MHWWKILLVVFLAELPCLLRTVALQTYSKQMLNVIVGTLLGNLAALVIGIALGELINRHLGEKEIYLNYIAGSMLIFLGLHIMFWDHH